MRYLIAISAFLFAGGVILSAAHHYHLGGIVCLIGGAVSLLLFNLSLMLASEA